MNLKDKANEIIEYYGIKGQMPVWCEEMGELIQVICKWQRSYEKLEGDITYELKNKFITEVADVEFCLLQIKTILNIAEEVADEMESKADRQIERFREEITEKLFKDLFKDYEV